MPDRPSPVIHFLSTLRNLPGAAVVAVLVILSSLTPAATPAAGAQTGAPQTLRLASQTAWRLPDQPFTLALQIGSPTPEALEVAVSVHRRVSSRSEFAQTLEGRLAGRPIVEVPPAAVTELEQDATGSRTVTFTPPVAREGVYPVKVDLRPVGGGRPVDSFVTHLLNVPEAVEGDKLGVAWLVPVHAPPAVQPDGRAAIDDHRAETLAGLSRSLERHADVAVTLTPTPETIEALATSARDEDRTTMASLARAAGAGRVLSGSYVSTSVPGLLEAGLRDEAEAQLRRGASTLARYFGAPPDAAGRFLDERLPPDAIGFLQSQQVSRVVVPEAVLEPVARNTTLTQPFELEGRPALPAAMADAGAAAHFSTPAPALAAHRLLADLAVVYFDSPGTRRGVVVAPPRQWEPSEVFSDALLGSLRTSPILAGVTVDRIFSDVPPATANSRPLVRRMAPGPAPASLPGATVRRTRAQVTAFASALDSDNPILDRLDRTLLASQSSDLRARDRGRYAAGVADQISGEVRRIAMPRNRSITLTAREAKVPITVTTRLGYPVRAVLQLESETLEFPDGAAVDLSLVRQNTTSQFTVRARSSGSFPLRVRLVSPDGGIVMAESRVTVRSTAVSGVGTALSIGAGVFLLVWWANHFRIRRSRRLVHA